VRPAASGYRSLDCALRRSSSAYPRSTRSRRRRTLGRFSDSRWIRSTFSFFVSLFIAILSEQLPDVSDIDDEVGQGSHDNEDVFAFDRGFVHARIVGPGASTTSGLLFFPL
jgi:hypothetical protein